MLSYIMYEEIQNYKKSGLFKADIVEKTKRDWKTVRKYYNMTKDEYEVYRDSLSSRKKILDPFSDEIIGIFNELGNRPLQATSVYDLLLEKHGEMPSCEKTLRNHINHLIENRKITLNKQSRLHSPVKDLPMGKQLQLDFGEYNQKNGQKIYFMGCVLSASRYKYACIQFRSFRTDDVIKHLSNCFDHFGGIPEELVIDQDHLMVTAENNGDLIYTSKFQQFLDETGLKMWVCRKNDPASKGKIENVIKYVKKNFLSVRTFASEEDANISLKKWLKRRANGKVSKATQKIPAILFLQEKKALKPFKAGLFLEEHKEFELRKVNKKLKSVMVDTCQYPVPEEYSEKDVYIDRKADSFSIIGVKSGKQLGNYSYLNIKCSVHPDCYRQCKDSKLDELKEEILVWSGLPEWKEFVEKCRTGYKKYFRDQYKIAGKHIKDITQKKGFCEALRLCIELNSFSMKNLSDTFKHLNHLETLEEIKLPGFVKTEKNTPYKNIAVASRNLNEYMNYQGLKGVENEQLQ